MQSLRVRYDWLQYDLRMQSLLARYMITVGLENTISTGKIWLITVGLENAISTGTIWLITVRLENAISTVKIWLITV